MAPRISPLREALRVAVSGAPRLVGTGARMLAAAWPAGMPRPTLVDERRAPDIDWVGRLGAAATDTATPPKPLYLRAPDAQPQDAAPTGAAMSGVLARALGRLFWRAAPAIAEAGPHDAAAIAALHGVAFRRGWSEHEVETLLGDRAVIAHSAGGGGALAGFIMSRCAADEAEILSVAVAPPWRGRPRPRPADAASAPARRPRRPLRVPRSRRDQRSRDPALYACGLPRGRPPPQLLPGRRRKRMRWYCGAI